MVSDNTSTFSRLGRFSVGISERSSSFLLRRLILSGFKLNCDYISLYFEFNNLFNCSVAKLFVVFLN